MELVKGQVVFSRRGRDVGKAYVVVSLEGGRALLCDGCKRPLAAPKQKNLHHINPSRIILEQRQMDTDVNLKAALKAYEDTHEPGAEGTSKGG
jgi:ribosomal protein L14E/L6E/L27E